MQPDSRFGLNLFLHLVLIVVISVVASSLPGSVEQLLSALGKFLLLSFFFGLFYGFFRLFGARGGFLEHYYQNFPLGKLFDFENGQSFDSPANQPDALSQHTTPLASRVSRSQNLQESLSAIPLERFVQLAGILLIVSAVFSLVFKIEWGLIEKTTATLLGAIALGGGAFLLRQRNVPTIAAVLALVSFALLQFGFSLLHSVMLTYQVGGIAETFELWLLIKLLSALVVLYFSFSFESDFLPLAVLTVGYLGPVTLQPQSALPLTFFAGSLVYLMILVVTGLFTSMRFGRWELLVVNPVVSTGVALWLYALLGAHATIIDLSNRVTGGSNPEQRLLFLFFALGFVVQLATIVKIALDRANTDNGLWGVAVSAVHGFSLVGMVASLNAVPFLAGSYGTLFLLVSVISFAAYLILDSRKVASKLAEVLIQLAFAVSAIGLFLETRGPWTAIIFLIYSSVVVAISLRIGSRSMRVYSALVLLVSLAKLYFECSQLFDSVPGTLVILVLGVIFLVLSQRLGNKRST